MLNLDQLPNQQRDERPVLFLRRHWIQLVALGGYGFLFIAVPLVLRLVIEIVGIDPTSAFWEPIFLSALAVYIMFAGIILMTQFTDYYLDTWVVTTERIINIEQRGLFSRVVSTLHLNQIQDVTSETHGFLNTFLTYGDVYIQTAGTRERFNFKTIDNPEEVKNAILELVEADKRRHGDASQVSA
jgi:hypothetical protein